MIISNFAVVCRMPDCHGRITPDAAREFSSGTCAKYGMHTDEFMRRYRPNEWQATQKIRGLTAADAADIPSVCD
jgi:hypothetical protein